MRVRIHMRHTDEVVTLENIIDDQVQDADWFKSVAMSRIMTFTRRDNTKLEMFPLGAIERVVCEFDHDGLPYENLANDEEEAPIILDDDVADEIALKAEAEQISEMLEDFFEEKTEEDDEQEGE